MDSIRQAKGELSQAVVPTPTLETNNKQSYRSKQFWPYTIYDHESIRTIRTINIFINQLNN